MLPQLLTFHVGQKDRGHLDSPINFEYDLVIHSLIILIDEDGLNALSALIVSTK